MSVNGMMLTCQRAQSIRAARARLRGFLLGVAADQKLNDMEMNALKTMRLDAEGLFGSDEFSTIGFLLDRALVVGALHQDERLDLLESLLSLEAEVCESTLLGLLSGMASDDHINSSELKVLLEFVRQNEDLFSRFPFDKITLALSDFFSRRITEEQLLATIKSVTQVDYSSTGSISEDQVPLCDFDEVDNVVIEGSVLVFTGKFGGKTGFRKVIEERVVGLGGVLRASVTTKTNYLVVGDETAVGWITSTYGRKIQMAMDLRRSDAPNLRVLTEQNLRAVRPNLFA